MGDTDSNPSAPGSWDGHRTEQMLWIARNTTAEQRFQWLEDTIEMLRPQLPELLKNRQMLLDAERNRT